VGRDPWFVAKDVCDILISIHSPRVGRDSSTSVIPGTSTIFQSTLPVWGETSDSMSVRGSMQFQSTLPVWGETFNDFYRR